MAFKKVNLFLQTVVLLSLGSRTWLGDVKTGRGMQLGGALGEMLRSLADDFV